MEALEIQRGHIIREIIASEKNYNNLLEDFYGCYRVALISEIDDSAKNFMARSSLVALVANFEQVLHASKQLLKELSRSVKGLEEFGEENKANIGEVFLNTFGLLKLYGQYAENHALAQNDIREMMENREFKQFWDRTETDGMLGKQVSITGEMLKAPSSSCLLDSYLILPIQRIPRYTLLLKELLKVTREETNREEYLNLKKAIEEVTSSARFMNDCIVQSQEREKLKDLQSKFNNTIDLLSNEKRSLLFEGELVKISTKGVHAAYYFHLLAPDCLLYSTVHENTYKLHKRLTLNESTQVFFAGIPEERSMYDAYVVCEGNESTAFRIQTMEKTFVVYAKSPQARDAWMTKIKDLVGEKKTVTGLQKKPTIALEDHECCSGGKKSRKKQACGKCGAKICAECAAKNERAISEKETKPVCVRCAGEMDSTKTSEESNCFRLRMRITQIQTLIAKHNKQMVLQGEALTECTSEDGKEARRRIYFVLSDGRGNVIKGPSGVNDERGFCDFVFPIRCFQEEEDAAVLVRFFILGVGEVGYMELDLEDLLGKEQIKNGLTFRTWMIVEKANQSFGLSALASSLLQKEQNLESFHKQLSEKEKNAMQIGCLGEFQLLIPPALYGLREDDGVNASELVINSNNVFPEVRKNQKVNIGLLKMYEEKCRVNFLPELLYSDAINSLGVYSDTQLGLINRLSKFSSSSNNNNKRRNTKVGEKIENPPPIAMVEAAPAETAIMVSEEEMDRKLVIKEICEMEEKYLRNVCVLQEKFIDRILKLSEEGGYYNHNEEEDDWGLKIKNLNASSSFSLQQKKKKQEEFYAGLKEVLEKPAMKVFIHSIKQIKRMNEEFLSSLKERPYNRIGDLIESFFAGVMPVYSTYATNHFFVLDDFMMDELFLENIRFNFNNNNNNNKPLHTLVSLIEKETGCSLKFLLNEPIKRVEEYRMAFSALLMCTDKENQPEEWERTRLCLSKIVQATMDIGNSIKKRENLLCLKKIFEFVDGWPGRDFNLVDHKRFLIREGCLIEKKSLNEKMRKRYFFLFNDCLVVCSKIVKGVTKRSNSFYQKIIGNSSNNNNNNNSNKIFRFVRMIPLEEVTICDLPNYGKDFPNNEEAFLGNTNLAFCVASIGCPSFIALVPNNPAECSTRNFNGQIVYDKHLVKAAWIEDFQKSCSSKNNNTKAEEEDVVLEATYGNNSYYNKKALLQEEEGFGYQRLSL